MNIACNLVRLFTTPAVIDCATYLIKKIETIQWPTHTNMYTNLTSRNWTFTIENPIISDQPNMAEVHFLVFTKTTYDDGGERIDGYIQYYEKHARQWVQGKMPTADISLEVLTNEKSVWDPMVLDLILNGSKIIELEQTRFINMIISLFN